MDKKSYCHKCDNMTDDGMCVYKNCIYTESEIRYKLQSCKDDKICLTGIISALTGLVLIAIAAVRLMDI